MPDLDSFMAALQSYGSISLIAWNIITLWLVFEKAGVTGAAALIPYYNLFCVCKIARRKKLFVPLAILGSLFAVVGVILAFLLVAVFTFTFITFGAFFMMEEAGRVSVWLNLLCAAEFLLGAVSFVLYAVTMHGLSKRFGHGLPFALGLLFLSPVFFGILALGKSKCEPEWGYEPNAAAEGRPPHINGK